MQQQEYIEKLKKLGVVSGDEPYKYGPKINTLVTQMGMDYKDKSIELMHLQNLENQYIYDNYLKVFLYMYKKANKDDIAFKDIAEEYSKGEEKMINKLMDFFQKGGCQKTNYYLKEISKAYDAYKEKENKQFNDKSLEQLSLNDYCELEKWIKQNSKKEDYPTLYGE